MRGFALLACCAMVGCGGQPEDQGRLTAHIRFDPVLAPSDIKAVDLYLMAGRTRQGMALACPALAGAPLTTRSDLVLRMHRVQALMDTHLGGIAPEVQLVLAVDTYPTPDATGMRNGFGCRDGIVVRESEATAVTVLIAPP